MANVNRTISSFLVSTNSWGKRLVANCDSLLFGAEQAVYSGFLKARHWKQPPAAAGK